MKTPIDPHAPAFPSKQSNEHFAYPDTYHTGLTIRAHIATQMMAAILSHPSRDIDLANTGHQRGIDPVSAIAMGAVEYADALLAELNREEKP